MKENFLNQTKESELSFFVVENNLPISPKEKWARISQSLNYY